MDLAISREKSLFNFCLGLAILFWLILIIGTFGVGLLYIPIAYVVYLFIHSALIAYIKGNAVEITSEQFPDLHARIQKACAKLNMPVPSGYLMNGNGAYNAFATRFMRHHYIVLLSDVVDAFEGHESALDFYIGHELGHVHRKHLVWWPVFLPTLMLPLLNPAYRRACEKTCDQYGKFCCDNPEDAVFGLGLLAAGGKRWKSMSSANFVAQSRHTGGFWMSFHEITASYPWLSKRVALVKGENPGFPKRHVGAWILGAFCPGFMTGAFLPILIAYVGFIGLAIAIPNFQKYTEKARAKSAAAAPAESETQWTNPLNQKVLDLPPGFTSLPAQNKSDLIVGTFTTDPNKSLEQLLAEKIAEKMTFKEYTEALYQSKAKLLTGKYKLSAPTVRTVDGLQIVEFGFESNEKGQKFSNVIRGWTHDNVHFWHVISTMQTGDAATARDSERFLEFIVEGSKG